MLLSFHGDPLIPDHATQATFDISSISYANNVKVNKRSDTFSYKLKYT